MKKEAHTMNEKTLTSEQRATLIAYILMTTKMREEEAAAWDNKAKLGNRAGRVSLVDRGRRFTGAD